MLPPNCYPQRPTRDESFTLTAGARSDAEVESFFGLLGRAQGRTTVSRHMLNSSARQANVGEGTVIECHQRVDGAANTPLPYKPGNRPLDQIQQLPRACD